MTDRRVIRGGCWYNSPLGIGAGIHTKSRPKKGDGLMGFRLRKKRYVNRRRSMEVCHGGAWPLIERDVAPRHRDWWLPTELDASFGFRLLRRRRKNAIPIE